ncbi:permease [Marinobacter sp. F4218]|uniref:permease n=1 Tax=Marinobacter sp. F4218 TaxID=2862868 RepID=UPI001C637090|nr:permease [Marinobacter sp. F4218]MBW7469505.1 permease [Marinobacter sp. F4218]
MSAQLQDTLFMFTLLATELSVLFIGISFLVGALQRHIPPSRLEALLSNSGGRGYLIAAGLGAITPFCSCSTIPMLKGLIRARVSFGPMTVFLFASPLLNPVVVVLLFATFGVGLTAIYVLAALTVSLAAGWSLQALGYERYLRREENPVVSVASSEEKSCTGASVPGGKYSGLWREALSDFVRVSPYLLIGVAIGSAIYGYLPTDLLAKYAGQDNPLAIPVAAVIGVPLYIRAEAVIPMASALMTKGVGAGAVLALIIGSAGASLTELILLRSLFTPRLLLAFVTVVLAMAVAAGYGAFLFF